MYVSPKSGIFRRRNATCGSQRSLAFWSRWKEDNVVTWSAMQACAGTDEVIEEINYKLYQGLFALACRQRVEIWLNS